MKTKEEILDEFICEELLRYEEDFFYRNEVLELMDKYANVVLRDELIKFSQPFYADEETCIHNVDEYLKNRKT